MRIIGLDVGVNSIGFSLVDMDKNEILEMGSHLFEAAEHPKTGASLALPRREARGMRRRTTRKARKVARLRKELIEHGLDAPKIIRLKSGDKSPWLLRKEGLERPLSDGELARVLVHFAKRPGFQTNRKSAPPNEETTFTKAGNELYEAMRADGGRTIGAWLAGQPKQRNDPERYERTVIRDHLRDEIRTLIKRQRDLGNAKATERLCEDVIEFAFFRRPLQSSLKMVGKCAVYGDEGEKRAPKKAFHAELFVALSRLANLTIMGKGEKRPLSEEEIAGFERQMLKSDKITFAQAREILGLDDDARFNLASYPRENLTRAEIRERAEKETLVETTNFSSSRLANLTVMSPKGEERPLTMEEIAQLEQKMQKNKKVTFAQARKTLGLDDDARFNLACYSERNLTPDEIREQAEKETLVEMAGFHTLRKALGKISKMDWAALAARPDDLDRIACALSFFESEDDIREELKKLSQPLSEDQVVALLGVTGFSKTINISLRAAKEINPYLRRGVTYMEAVLKIRPDHQTRAGERTLLPPLGESTRNPVVDRALSQIRKVVNALVRKHGMPDHFHVETARDLGRNFKERKAVEAENKKRQTFKEETRKHAAEIYGFEPNGDELARFRLWKEQDGFCPYSGEAIKPHHLQNGTDTQIDHILPRGRSYDDSWSNKVLCFSRENQAKSNLNLTAWEYMERNGKTRELEAFAARQNFHRREKLLMRDFDEEKENAWKSRHLNDTRYVARALSEYLEENLKPNPGVTKLVRTRKGELTSKLRHLWRLPEKDRQNDHRHHGVDALVIACATDGMVQKAARWSRYTRGKKGDPGFYAEAPWENFRAHALSKMDGMFVTRQPARKTGGKLHKETIMSLRCNDGGGGGEWRAVKRIKVGDLKRPDLENLVDVTVVDGQPRGRNAALYQVLHDRLAAFGFKNEKGAAFAEPVFMPLKPGKTGPDGESRGPRIRRVRVYDNTRAGFRLTDKTTGREKSIADNAEMAWTEVYEKAGKFYLLPVYTWQVAAKRWPDRLITQGKPEDQWDELDASYAFLFSLFKNDFVRLEDKNGVVREGYFKGADRGTGSITIENHKGASKDRPYPKNMKFFKKYHIGLFGGRREVRERSPWRGEP